MSARFAPLLVPALLAGCASALDFNASTDSASDGPNFVLPEGTDQSPNDDAHWDRDEAESALDGTWYGEVLVSNDAVILDGLQGFTRFERSGDAVTLYFTGDAGDAGIRQGDVVVSGMDGGLMVRVEGVQTFENRLLLATSAASLTDVILHAVAAERIALPMETGDLPPSPLRDPRTYDFSGTPLYSASGGTGSVLLEVESGVLTLDPELDFGVNIDWADWTRPWPKLEKANLAATLGADLELVLHAAADGAVDTSGTRDLFQFAKPFAFQVGPVPIAGDVNFDVDLTWNLAADGTADAKVGTHVVSSVTLGGRYDDGDWFNDSGFSWDDSLIGPELDLDGSLSARASLVVTASVSLYSAVSMDAMAEPWTRADAAFDCGNIDWSVDIGVDIVSSASYDILGTSDTHDFPTFAWDKDLAQGVLPVYDADLDPSCGADGPVDSPVTTSSEGSESGGSERPETEADAETMLATEQCVDGIDNDADGAIDCSDDECADSMACGSECRVWDNIGCGSIVSASTAGFAVAADSRVMGYPINPGLYSGPEAAFAFRAPISGDVTFRLVDPDPTEVDQDVMVLHTPTGVCASQHAVAWGPNTVQHEVTRGEQYLIVVDGFDGDAGDFTLQVVCGG